MVTITVSISGEIYYISDVDSLTKVQNVLTNKFFEQMKDESEVIDRYFADTPHLEIYDRICDYPELMDDIVDKAVEEETDYQTLEEVSNALSSMQDALDCIYNTSRDFV